MATVLTPRLLRRGFDFFLLASLVSVAGTLLYGNSLPAFFHSVGEIHWPWLLVGLALASLDWIGGGLRLWVVAREIHPNPPIGGMMIAGGMSAWAAYMTPLNSGAGPMMIYAMRRSGVPVPVAVTSVLMTFIATVVFFAIAGPAAILAGAGHALTQKGNVLGLSLYDLFLGSLGIFVALGALFAALFIAPTPMIRGVANLVTWLGKRSPWLAARLERVQVGIQQAHQSLLAFKTKRGVIALGWATLLSGPSHANKLLAGYVSLRAIGIEANFVDMLLVQTLITFLLYFAPTPGGSGIGEFVSTMVMANNYVPRELNPLYTIIWRLILSGFTIAFGFWVFRSWVRGGLTGIGAAGDDADETAATGTATASAT